MVSRRRTIARRGSNCAVARTERNGVLILVPAAVAWGAAARTKPAWERS